VLGIWKQSRMSRLVKENPILTFAREHEHEPKEIAKFTKTLKFDSMQIYDKIKDGMADIAASIKTPKRHGPSAYTDPLVDRDSQRTVTFLRMGAFAFHQACKKCGQETSRKHAALCSGGEFYLQSQFQGLYAEFNRRRDTKSLLFQDFLLNKMDGLYLSAATVDRQLSAKILEKMVVYAKAIRSLVSGYVQTQDGRSWYHPDKRRRKKIAYRRYRQSASITRQRAHIALLRNRPVGRPARKRNQEVTQPP
jgi:hypothetical protein